MSKPLRLLQIEDSESDADMIIRKAMPHVRAMMGFDLRRNQFATQGNLLYLGGVIHTAKLRMTLLSQYGI